MKKKKKEKSFFDIVLEVDPASADIVAELKQEAQLNVHDKSASETNEIEDFQSTIDKASAVPLEVATKLLVPLRAEDSFAGTRLLHTNLGDLQLPTGRIVVCDPVAYPETKPLALRMPRGQFPVNLCVAGIDTDQRVAFASVRFISSEPIQWASLTLLGSKTPEPAYCSIDSGVAAFMDTEAQRELILRGRSDMDRLASVLDVEMSKSYVPTWSWLNVPFGNGNLIAFSPGYGDGVYGVYGGFDHQDKICAIVVDFQILKD